MNVLPLSASEWGSEGREFKSHRPDHLSKMENSYFQSLTSETRETRKRDLSRVDGEKSRLDVTTNDDKLDDK